jgi:hypothetical protein
MSGSYRSGCFKTASRERAKYKSVLVGVQEVRWDKGGTEPGHRWTQVIKQRRMRWDM